ncbi:MAG: BON domain-containing protein [Proteobacteria bacterium]|nr:BON domain-containing protein [Pseudomonadota bacterium]
MKKRPEPTPIDPEDEVPPPAASHLIREEDGFNEQPGSGSTIGGLRGEQEYGIEGEIAEEEEHTRPAVVSIDREGCGGLSQFSAGGVDTLVAKTEASDELLSTELPESGAELEGLIAARLSEHPFLKGVALSVHLSPHNQILLRGTVHSESARLAAVELVEALAPALPLIAIIDIIPQ